MQGGSGNVESNMHLRTPRGFIGGEDHVTSVNNPSLAELSRT